MKLPIIQIQRSDDERFMAIIWFKIRGELVRIKLTKSHYYYLQANKKIPKKLTKGLILNVRETQGIKLKIYSIYGYEKATEE